MPLFNTISASSANEVKTYNYISNTYPSGVPTGSLADANGTPGDFTGTFQLDWLAGQVLPSTAMFSSGTTVYYYFPAVPDTPTRNESLTGQAATSAYRFTLSLPITTGLINNTGVAGNISTTTNGSITNQAVINMSVGAGTANAGTTIFNFFNFGAASSTTIALAGFRTPTSTGGDLLTTATASAIVITGWVYNHSDSMDMVTYPSLRFTPCYTIMIRGTNPALSTSSSIVEGIKPVTLNSSSVHVPVHGYMDLECSAGSATVPVLTDFPLFRLSGDFRVFMGTADNRVVCMGRGIFQAGRVYRINNCFGRTGEEDWLCVAPYTPSTYNVANWTVGSDGSFTKVWKINEEDYVLIRVFTEGS